MDLQEQPASYRYESGMSAESESPSGFDEQKARNGVCLLLEAIGRNPDEAELSETWNRRAPEMLETLSEGMREVEKPMLRMFDAESDELIVKTGIPLYSLCEHHLLPFHGRAHVAYRPDEGMVGLSKLVRYVRWRSRRLTTQEELTRDIATGLAAELDANGVLVELTATHMCEAMRGVETQTATTTRETVGNITDIDRRRFRNSIRRDAEQSGGSF
jgi:GTP cyclohydrolase IA